MNPKIYKAIDSLEALIQHNISDLSTWSSNEYELNKTYADDRVGFSAHLTQLRQEIRKDTLEKLQQEKRITATKEKYIKTFRDSRS